MDYPFVPFSRPILSESELIHRSEKVYQEMDQRRSVRHFSDRDIPTEVIQNLIKTAGTAPSGAHKQPWHFVAIRSAELKQRIRELAEKEEKESYNGRMTEEWLKDLAPLGTDWEKPFLTIAPWIIVAFRKPYDLVDGQKKNNYYVNESVGLACGMLIAAVHQCGLATLTHTPSPMNFLAEALGRPENEKPFLLLPIGFPAEDAKVPDLKRKSLDEIATFVL
jgi:nitroreductase